MTRSSLSTTPRLRRPGLRLVALFSMLTAFLLTWAVLVVGRETRESIDREARTGAEQTAEVFTRMSLEPEEYSDGEVTDEGVDDLRHNLELSDAVVGFVLRDRDGRVVARIGRHAARAPRAAGTESAPSALQVAFAGETRSEVVRGVRGGEMLSVSVPVVLPGERTPASVLQSYLPYAPVKAQITARTRRLYVMLGVFGLVLYVALVPTLLRASRVLTRNYEARHLPLQRELRRAMHNGELELHYQPKIELGDGSLHGVEALLRWRHPKHGMIAPLEFLPQAESTPIIGPLMCHVFRLACRQTADWRREGMEVDVAVNLSPANLTDDMLPGRLATILRDEGLDARSFTLEVTETAVMEASIDVEQRLAALRDMGFRLSVDDFGSGYSSLARLDRLPIDEVKIDRSFIRSIEHHGDTRILTAVIRLAHELDVACVAEGIESGEIAERLAEMGCPTGQGYHWTRPLPAAELRSWLESRVDATRPMVAA